MNNELEGLGKKEVVGWMGKYLDIYVEKLMISPTSQGQDSHIPNRKYKHFQNKVQKRK